MRDPRSACESSISPSVMPPSSMGSSTSQGRHQVDEAGLGRRRQRLFRLHLAEHRRVLDLRAQIHADQAHRRGHQERQAPAPGVHGLVAQQEREAQHQEGAQREARKRSELQEAAEEATLLVRGVLGHERGGAAVLAARREPLDHPQDDQEER